MSYRFVLAAAFASIISTSAFGSVRMSITPAASGAQGLFGPAGLSTVDNFTLDVSGIEGIGGAPNSSGGATGIDEVTFKTNVHAMNISGPGGVLGVPSVGDIYSVNVLGVATGLFNDSSGEISGFTSGMGAPPAPWQLSFRATVPVSVTGVAGGGFTFTHVGGGLLELYVDGPAGGQTAASPVNGEASYVDGTNIADFVSNPGLGGGVNTSTFDGSDDATYSLTFAVPGVIKDSSGVDIGTGSLLSLIDSNFDLNPAGAVPNTWTATGVSPWPTASPSAAVNTSFAEFYASEDGSLRLAIPEPTTMAIWASLVGIGLVAGSRRRLR